MTSFRDSYPLLAAVVASIAREMASCAGDRVKVLNPPASVLRGPARESAVYAERQLSALGRQRRREVRDAFASGEGVESDAPVYVRRCVDVGEFLDLVLPGDSYGAPPELSAVFLTFSEA